jgi:hypothetical protein
VIIYLSGAVRPEFLQQPDAGFMLTPAMGNRPSLALTWWAADNGCYAHPERFELEDYLAWLEERRCFQQTCLLVTAPDVRGDARETLKRSLPVLPLIRSLGYKAALCAQDGLEELEMPWQEFDVLFVGGTDPWRKSEAMHSLTAEARLLGKWTHLGRVNSFERLQAAYRDGFDSADGTYAAYGPNVNAPKVLRWLRSIRQQPALWQPARLASTGKRG